MHVDRQPRNAVLYVDHHLIDIRAAEKDARISGEAVSVLEKIEFVVGVPVMMDDDGIPPRTG